MYRVMHKSLRDFRPLRYSSRDGHVEGEHVNRGRDIPIFCPILQVLDMFALGEAADVNSVIKFVPHTCNVCGQLHNKDQCNSHLIFLLSPKMLQSVLRHSKIVLTVTVNGM